MAILTKDDARSILEKVLKLSKADGCEVNVNGGVGGNLRFARNTVTTSGAVEQTGLSVQSNFGKKSGTATINEYDDASLEKVVRRSEELAKLAPRTPSSWTCWSPQSTPDVEGVLRRDGDRSSRPRGAEAAKSAIVPAEKNDITVAGFYQDNTFFQAMLNSKGLFAYHSGTTVSFSLTARTNDGTGSGYAEREYNDVAKLDAGAVSKIAIQKGALSKNPKAIEPGKYTVILEPAAAVGLLQYVFFSMDARQADEGRSPLSKPGAAPEAGREAVGRAGDHLLGPDERGDADLALGE